MDVIAFVNNLFNEAVANRASDIHVEPSMEDLIIRQRIDGYLVETCRLPLQEAKGILSRLKIMGQLDIGEKRLPQDGAMTIQVGEKFLEVRLATLPVLYGEKIVLRLLPSELAVRTLSELGMEIIEVDRVSKLLHRQGLVAITGPTGAGKTTTLYTLLTLLDHRRRNIITLEDPIEVQLAGINQVQVHHKIGFTFAKGLRAILRQDPDVIMIGEIRDQETAEIAIEAALTGHLVLTSLHTADGSSVISRLIDMGIPSYLVASALSGIVAQRLMRLTCGKCKGKGCLHCRSSGYFNRTGIFEVLSLDETTQHLIMNHPSVSQIRQHFQNKGFRMMEQSLLQKYEQGLTTIEELKRMESEMIKIAQLEK
ncbi:GspE/PulE family protein [Shimazuella kribbensis]|uniref:GspE/PulE family protein n=1 Tax=Shimazuella kribbensis TaxID=139808 RepID=UPI00041B586F|nr:GspE/PulE family protein [Shimazuella kribbensis]